MCCVKAYNCVNACRCISDMHACIRRNTCMHSPLSLHACVYIYDICAVVVEFPRCTCVYSAKYVYTFTIICSCMHACNPSPSLSLSLSLSPLFSLPLSLCHAWTGAHTRWASTKTSSRCWYKFSKIGALVYIYIYIYIYIALAHETASYI